MMEVVVTTGAVRRAKLQSNRHHQQTNTQLFTGRCLSCRLVNGPIVSENYTHQVQQLHLDLCPFQSITWWEPFLQPCWTRVQSIKKVHLCFSSSRHWRKMLSHSMDFLIPTSQGLPTLSLTTKSSWSHWGGLPSLSSALWCHYTNQSTVSEYYS